MEGEEVLLLLDLKALLKKSFLQSAWLLRLQALLSCLLWSGCP